MEPKTNKTSNLQARLSNSLRGLKTNKDLESGAGNVVASDADPQPGASIANQALLDLLATIRKKRYHGNYAKTDVYKTLMDHLDYVEEKHPKFTSSLIAVELIVFSGLTAALVCSLILDSTKHRRLLGLRMWQYVTMAMMLASGLSVVRFITFAVTWPVMWRWRIHKYVVYFIRKLKQCVDVTLWFCVILLGWYIWFRPRFKRVHGDLSVVLAKQTTRFLITLCIGSFLWLLKNVLYLKLEADLHYDQLFDRVRLSVAYLHGIEIIQSGGRWKFLMDNKLKKMMKKPDGDRKEEEIKKFEREGKEIKMVNIWREVLEMERESVPIWVLLRLSEEYLNRIRIKPLPGNVDLVNDDQRLLTEAKKMYNKIKKIQDNDLAKSDESNDEIKREDLYKYLSKEEVEYLFKHQKKEEDEEEESEQQGSGSTGSSQDRGIGRDEFLNWVVRAYKNCWSLERTLYSSKKVFIKLNRLLSAFLLTVVLIVWLLLSEIVNTGQLALLFTPFLAASFIFGDSCKKMFEGLIFTFAMHPFDVSDRVIIGDAQMRVTKLNILTSVFYKYETGEEVIIPNSTLTTTNIINLDITPDQSDKLEFIVDAQTPLEDIQDLEVKVQKLLDDYLEYSSNTKVVKSEIGREEIKMTVYFKYLVSYLSAETKAVHKSNILSMIMKFLTQMDMNKIKYPPLYEPYIVEITLKNFKLKDIEDLKEEIRRSLVKLYNPDSKVVMMELTKNRIKMGVYIAKSEKEKEKEDESKISADRVIIPLEEDFKQKEIKKNLEDISKSLKEKKKNLVKNVKIHPPINNGNDQVIAQGGLGCTSFQAGDVIDQGQDNANTSPETIPSREIEGPEEKQDD